MRGIRRIFVRYIDMGAEFGGRIVFPVSAEMEMIPAELAHGYKGLPPWSPLEMLAEGQPWDSLVNSSLARHVSDFYRWVGMPAYATGKAAKAVVDNVRKH